MPPITHPAIRAKLLFKSLTVARHISSRACLNVTPLMSCCLMIVLVLEIFPIPSLEWIAANSRCWSLHSSFAANFSWERESSMRAISTLWRASCREFSSRCCRRSDDDENRAGSLNDHSPLWHPRMTWCLWMTLPVCLIDCSVKLTKNSGTVVSRASITRIV